MNKKEIGAKLKQLRLDKGLRLKDVSEYLGLSWANGAGQIESRLVISVLRLEKLCKFYGTTISELLDGEIKHTTVSFHKRLLNAKKKYGLTNYKLADKLGCKHSNIQNWTGKGGELHLPCLPKYVEVCKKLDKLGK